MDRYNEPTIYPAIGRLNVFYLRCGVSFNPNRRSRQDEHPFIGVDRGKIHGLLGDGTLLSLDF